MNYSIPSPTLMANRAAKAYGTNRATSIIVSDQCRAPRVTHYDSYHAESRTGIRAGIAALKHFWSTYHYVPTVCVVIVPDIDAIYSDDNH